METIEVILEKLLKDKDCYDGSVIEKRMATWPGRHSKRNALYNIGLNCHCFDEDEIAILESFNIFRGRFNNELVEFRDFVNKLDPDNREKFLNLSHFYYCWCLDPEIYNILDESFKLIIITSIIESLVSDRNYKEFYDWFCSECSIDLKNDSEKITDPKKRMEFLWVEYKKIHGAMKKVRYFFESCVNKDDQEQLTNGFKRLSKKSVNLDQVVSFLYQLRSDFLHNANAVMLAEDGCSLGHVIGGTPLSIVINIAEILIIFENGFLEYFKPRPIRSF